MELQAVVIGIGLGNTMKEQHSINEKVQSQKNRLLNELISENLDES